MDDARIWDERCSGSERLFSGNPNGVLVTEVSDLPPGHERDFDPNDYCHPADVAGLLDGGWEVLADGARPRTAPAPPGTHHVHDTVLRALRLR
ncbi:hypothetical protein [Nocardiopsis sp. CNT312]|uniref:hypothetical protein n=1 Tax=Nocardiopsis sp. CNT312 TaxID=1137268 RepID=UPI0004908841|nr:hypothetical protein [Nocardiopsis sp. CNT312]